MLESEWAPEQAWIDAIVKRNRAALENVMSADFVLTNVYVPGFRRLRTQWITNTTEVMRTAHIRCHDLTVENYGDIAVANCRWDWKLTWDGQDASADYVFADVWIKNGSDWAIRWRSLNGPADSVYTEIVSKEAHDRQ